MHIIGIIRKQLKVIKHESYSMSKIKVSAAIVSYNGFEEVAQAASSVLAFSQGVELDLFIIDNCSPDGTGQRLLESELAQKAKIIALNKNLGFGTGHNMVLSKIDSEYHAVINPDITLSEETLLKICEYMQNNPKVAIVTPRLMFPTGIEQHTAKRRPSFMGLLARQVPVPFLKDTERHYLMLDEDLTKPCEVEFCSGCFFVIRTEIFKKMGGFDEKYFMYVEDADITQKALKYGKAVFYPYTFVYHAWHRDTKKKLKNFVMQIKSMLRYWRKWGFKFK